MFNLNLLLVFSDWAIFLLRLVVGIVFLVHGFSKLTALKATWKNFDAKGVKPGWFWGTIMAILETAGGLLLVLGLWVQILALLLGVQKIAVTLWKIIKGYKFVSGYELDLLLIAAVLILATIGGGLFSLQILF